MLWIALGLTVLGAYLLGSIPSGYIAGLSCGIDLRKEGSQNVGATNAVRVLGKRLGYLVFLADFSKGCAAVILARHLMERFFPDQGVLAAMLAAVFVMVGHIFPVWLRFQGGKGIATAAGIIAGLFPFPVLIFGVILWVVLFYTTRYVSVASIAAAVSLPTSAAILWAFQRCELGLVCAALVMCALSVWRHVPNIRRLAAGTEKKFERKRPIAQN